MTLLYLNSDQMGSGDSELGKKLLCTFLDKLAHSSQKVDLVGCVNSGINLTTQQGKALESLKQLQEKGARIASCGTCLDHHGKRGNLLIGEIGSMDDTIEVMFQADKIVRPN